MGVPFSHFPEPDMGPFSRDKVDFRHFKIPDPYFGKYEITRRTRAATVGLERTRATIGAPSRTREDLDADAPKLLILLGLESSG